MGSRALASTSSTRLLPRRIRVRCSSKWYGRPRHGADNACVILLAGAGRELAGLLHNHKGSAYPKGMNQLAWFRDVRPGYLQLRCTSPSAATRKLCPSQLILSSFPDGPRGGLIHVFARFLDGGVWHGGLNGFRPCRLSFCLVHLNRCDQFLGLFLWRANITA